MLLGVMDYRFLPFHYFILIVLIISQIPLFGLGPINTHIKIEVSDLIGWGFLIFSFLLVAFNIKINGLPFVISKILSGSALNEQSGEYYHKKIRLTAILWPLLTILIPMSLLVKRKLLKYLLIFWALFSSAMIQIKSPFIFGFIYFLIFFQLTGRRLKAIHLGLLLSLMCLLFVAINYTRTSDEFSAVAILMGISYSYQSLSPVIWLPLSYLGGPIANGFQIMGTDAFNFNIYPYVLTVPELLLKDEARTAFSLKTSKDLLWPETNNAISAIGSISHMFGIAGMMLLVFLMSFTLIQFIKKNFFGNIFVLAISIVTLKNIALFPIGNYFIDPSFWGELGFFIIFFYFAKIKLLKNLKPTS